ncbi:hypothetical protein ACIRBX_02430 [Kitasatospora sp. NPDC096147]|uniref:hypothetical protein n=1 Tax=Kitasatospora sp. NPDC096147 TaxID=3364093 RepID=UPI0037F5CA28
MDWQMVSATARLFSREPLTGALSATLPSAQPLWKAMVRSAGAGLPSTLRQSTGSETDGAVSPL